MLSHASKPSPWRPACWLSRAFFLPLSFGVGAGVCPLLRQPLACKPLAPVNGQIRTDGQGQWRNAKASERALASAARRWPAPAPWPPTLALAAIPSSQWPPAVCGKAGAASRLREGGGWAAPATGLVGVGGLLLGLLLNGAALEAPALRLEFGARG